MKSFNHKCIKVCLSMKVSLLYISIIYELIIILFHLQMMPTISLTALSAVIQEVASVSHYINQMASNSRSVLHSH